MIAKMHKVQVGVLAVDREGLLAWLQDEEILHITPLAAEVAPEVAETDTAYQLAQVQFALEFVQRVRDELDIKETRHWQDVFAGNPVASLDELEKTLTALKLPTLLKKIRVESDTLAEVTGQREQLMAAQRLLAPWQRLAVTGEQLPGTVGVDHWLITVSLPEEATFTELLAAISTATWQEANRIIDRRGGTLYLEVVVEKSERAVLEEALTQTTAEAVELTLAVDETPAQRLKKIETELATLKKTYQATLADSKQFVQVENKLKFAYDALLHREEREELVHKIARTPLTAVVAGWLPVKRLGAFSKRLQAAFPSAAVEEVAPEKDETPPVLLENTRLLQPFEAVTNIFGKPRYDELDPSPVLSLFFLVAFGLALSDAGYGIVMMVTLAAALRLLRFKRETKKMVLLLLYAGLFTTIIGALTGGWFGITLEELPPSAVRDALLSVKLIDPISSPIDLLLVAFAIGVVQLLFAWMVKAYDLWRKGQRFAALVDAVAWITMVVFVLAWAGAQQGVLPASFQQPALWLLLANAGVLVATQGRQYKNPLLKLGSGILSLYGLVGFLSDVLSYSRLLALGLATGIIGLVVNLIGGMVAEMIPVVGIVLAIIVLIGGHIFNLGINTLGAFIHAGRLQFVEFFPKFMEGGGRPYKPFGRVSKYVDNPNEFR